MPNQKLRKQTKNEIRHQVFAQIIRLLRNICVVLQKSVKINHKSTTHI